MSLVDSVLNGDRLALARLLTQVENNTSAGLAALDELFPRTGKAHLIGVTGAPGTGKSSLVNQLALYYRKRDGKTVAIVAVDPSSPFTGGALLGDRIRMKDIGSDSGVFIRSMAARGSLGGLAQTSASLTQVFDAAGYEIVIIETVGAGQGEVDVARLAHTTLVVEAPGFGDDIQAIKAGILEIADILVINKADRPGVENTEKALKMMLELAHPGGKVIQHHGEMMQVGGSRSRKPNDLTPGPSPKGEGSLVSQPKPSPTPKERGQAGEGSFAEWIPPILKTVATEGTGIAAVAAQIARHAGHLQSTGAWAGRERLRLQVELEAMVRESLANEFHKNVTKKKYEQVLQQLYARSLSPWAAVKLLMNGREK